ncbi:MAG: GNAT family N-acetyltransferase, partial [Bacteroides sp.]|nr:GNAT family N-acetyltransferase [Bacteroides sp.]
YALTDSERMTGFIGLSSNLIEMLFIDDSYRGKGYGSALIDFALKQGATKVDVNEQNTSALNFYQARGFRIIGRDETDEAGRPYPILHLSL